MLKNFIKIFIKRNQLNSLINILNTFVSNLLMYISKATSVKLYRNFGYNYYQPDAGMGSFRPYVKILLENLEINEDIIEVGVGDNSTPMWTKKVNGLDHINSFHFENNLDWFEKIKSKFSSKDSQFIFFEGDKLLECFNNNFINEKTFDIAFIDSNPWETRTMALDYLKNISKVIIVHDSNYFPENNYWGNVVKEIQFKPLSKYWYGPLDKVKSGERNYDDVFKYWIEIFPKYPGYWTGPPTLFGSQQVDVASLMIPFLESDIFFHNSINY